VERAHCAADIGSFGTQLNSGFEEVKLIATAHNDEAIVVFGINTCKNRDWRAFVCVGSELPASDLGR
jgi:hypothetical protein